MTIHIKTEQRKSPWSKSQRKERQKMEDTGEVGIPREEHTNSLSGIKR